MGNSMTVAQIIAATIPQAAIVALLSLSFYAEFKKFKKKYTTAAMLSVDVLSHAILIGLLMWGGFFSVTFKLLAAILISEVL